MAHTPQHPDNPCSLAQNEQVPAKIWELLRRNVHFKKAVARLEELDKRPGLENAGPNRQPREVAFSMVRRLGELHGFAGGAIQWLVPEPLFEIHHLAIPAGLDLTRKKSVSLVTVKLQLGTTANPEDSAHWQTFEAQGERDAQSVANLNGRPWRRGPHLVLEKSEDPSFCSKVDSVQEWRDYFVNGRRFTLDTPWRDSPPPFKRKFCSLWRRLDSRSVNPITGTRIDVPCAHETRFFVGWNLMARLGKTPIQNEDLARALMFEELANHYRVFAFPTSIRSRTEARRKADWLFEQLCRLADGNELPRHEPEIYGTPLQWDVFLFAGQCNDKSLLKAYGKAKPEVKPIERQRKWRKERLNYIEHFRAMEREIAGIYPVKTMRPPA